MKLFLCSHFSSVGSLIKEEIENKKVAFIDLYAELALHRNGRPLQFAARGRGAQDYRV